jgi:hypothetical protein
MRQLQLSLSGTTLLAVLLVTAMHYLQVHACSRAFNETLCASETGRVERTAEATPSHGKQHSPCCDHPLRTCHPHNIFAWREI